jgi:DNA-binding Xre family transcriptional regulator
MSRCVGWSRRSCVQTITASFDKVASERLDALLDEARELRRQLGGRLVAVLLGVPRVAADVGDQNVLTAATPSLTNQEYAHLLRSFKGPWTGGAPIYSMIAMAGPGRKLAIERLRERAEKAIAPKEGYLFAQIADDVAARRAERRLSQRELAELTGTTQSAIARLERGGRPPRIDTLLRIAEALDCDLRVELKPR